MPALTAGPPERYRAIEVQAGARRATVPAAQAGRIAPLLIARDFGPPSSLAEYGLDHPSAAVSFATATGTITISIGQPNFDGTGFYAKRDDRLDVYLVLAGPIRPVLALVGVTG